MLLTACGGGGGGGGGEESAKATGDLTTANYEQVSNAATGPVLGSVAAAQEFERIASAEDSGAGLALDLGRLQHKLLDRFEGRSDRARALASSSETVGCSGGGSLLVTATFAREDRDTRGDKVTISSQGCIEDGLPVSGQIEAVLRDFGGSGDHRFFRMDLNAASFGTSQFSLNGSSTLQFDEWSSGKESLKVSFNGLTIRTPGETLPLHHGYEYVHGAGVPTLSLSGLLHVRGQTYRLEQRTAFTLSSAGYPQSGLLSLVDKDGDRVDVAATATRFTYTYFATGSSTPSAGPVNGLPYEQL